MQNKYKVALGSGALAVSAASFAQTSGAVDVSSITAALAQVTAAASTIGIAMLAMMAGVKMYKWLKSAL